jgi:hypothetical protein
MSEHKRKPAGKRQQVSRWPKTATLDSLSHQLARRSFIRVKPPQAGCKPEHFVAESGTGFIKMNS